MSEPVRIAVIGAGYFGSFHCEKVQLLPEAELAAVVDCDFARAKQVARRFGCEPLQSVRDLPGRIDAAVVAAPSQAHFEIAAVLLRAGIDVLVEKPLAVSLQQAEELCRLAEQSAACLQVGHLERFNPLVVRALSEVCGPRFVRMERSGPFSGRGSDVGVVFELMTHDLDILLQLSAAPLASVSAVGYAIATRFADVCSAVLEFEDGLRAELYASRLASHKSRAFSVLDERGLLEVDMPAQRLRRLSKNGIDQIEMIPAADVLLEQDRAFVQMLRNGRRPLVSGLAGRDAVALAERIMERLGRDP